MADATVTVVEEAECFEAGTGSSFDESLMRAKGKWPCQPNGLAPTAAG